MARLAAQANKDDRDSVLFRVLVLCDQKQETVTLKLVLALKPRKGDRA